jgi:Flp pilus assembly protein TadG
MRWRGWSHTHRCNESGKESGQATVELALTLPFIALLMLAVIQVVLIGRSQLALQSGVREAARACAVNSGCDAAGIVSATSGLNANVSSSIGGDVTVIADAMVPIIIPGLSQLKLTVDAQAVMRAE